MAEPVHLAICELSGLPWGECSLEEHLQDGGCRKVTIVPRISPLDAAREAVGERQENYGKPRQNFQHIADLWKAAFGWDVTPEDVAIAMILMKVSRLYRTPSHADSAVDIAGYIEAYSMLQHEAED